MKTSEMVIIIDEEAENLTSWEVGFISGFIDKPQETFSMKQAVIIERIYDEKC
jgi:hypothetical protein